MSSLGQRRILLCVWAQPATFKTFDANTTPSLNTNSFTTISVTYTPTTSAHFEVSIGAIFLTHFANYTPVPAQQTVGNAIVKNVSISVASAAPISTFTGNLTATGNIHANGTLTSSDKLLKTNLQELNTEECQKLVSAVSAQTYTCIDTGEIRCGFIANDIQANLPENSGNVLGNAVYEGHGILTLDYSRLICPLWQVVRAQQQQIESMSARLTALEATKTKTKTKKSE